MKLAVFVLACACVSVPTLAQVDNPDPVRPIVDWHGYEVAEGQVLVQFVPETPAYAQRDVVADVTSEVLETTAENLLLVSVPEGMTIDGTIALYEQFEDVEFAQPNVVHYTTEVPNDGRWNDLWALQFMDCAEAWDKYIGDFNYIVAVVDTGVRHTHNDLDDNYIGGWDYYSEDSNPNDNNGHGTHVSGTCAAETNNNSMVASSGRNVSLLGYRAGNGSFFSNDLVQCINDARVRGAHVQNYSWGSTFNDGAIRGAINTFYNAGGVPVAAAGNNGTTTRFYPAALSNVIGVASHTSGGGRSGFSTYGDWVSVAAGGSNILSTWDNGDNSLAYLDGTSMASPHVAGMATALYALHGGPRVTATADRVREVIEETSNNVSWVEFGRVDMHAAFCEMDDGGGDPGDPPGDCVDPAPYGDFTVGGGGVEPKPGFSNGWPSFGNSNFKITCTDARPNSTGTIFVGFDRDYVDNGNFILNVSLTGPPAALVLPTAYNAAGYSEIAAPIPNNPFIHGLQVDVQFIVFDPGAPTGVAATQGIEFFICDPNA